MGRYEAAPQEMIDIARTLIRDHFESLANANIIFLIDTEKRTSGGKLCLAKIQRANDLIRFLTKDLVEDVDGTDYIVTVDKLAWRLATPQDKVRILRHELRHTEYNSEAKNPYSLRGHTIEDFYEEVDLNAEDPRWADRLVMLVENERLIETHGHQVDDGQQTLPFEEPNDEVA